MRCKDVKEALAAYLDGEVMPSERTLLDAHLGGCESCRRELSELTSGRRRVAESLKTMAAQAAPSPQAWSHLQARFAEEPITPSGRLTRWIGRPAPEGRSTSRFYRQGDRGMKMRWKIVFGSVGAIVLAVAIIAAVPTTRAAAGGFFASVFHLEVKPLEFGYLPAGFDSQPLYELGSAEMVAQQQGDAPAAPKQAEQALYKNGDQFFSVKTSSDDGSALPSGEAATVNGRAAVLQTGLTGTVGAPAPPAVGDGKTTSGPVASELKVVTGSAQAGPVTEKGGDDSGNPGPDTKVIIESGSSSGEAGGAVVSGTPPDIPSITYANANSLTWVADGKRVEILTNLSVEEPERIAAGLKLGG